MNNPLVSIILVNYNTCELTCGCIRSIQQHVESVPYEILVVDNCSSDDSSVIIPTTFPNVRYIQTVSNLGFGRANNLGAKSARGKYLFLLNTDALLQNDPFPYFIRHMDSHPECGVVGGILTSPENGLTLSGGTIYSMKKYLHHAIRSYIHRIKRESYIYVPEFDPQKQAQEVGYVIGADMFIQRDVFNQVGGFDERIFMYFEDGELCKRLHQAGYTAWLIQGPRIPHAEGGSCSSQFARVHNAASLMYCLRKDTHPVVFRIFQVFYFIIRFPVIFERGKWQQNMEYLNAICHYENYLVQQNR